MSALAPVTVVDLSDAAPAGVDVAAATHIGPVRTENQDAFAAASLAGGQGVGALVADGMGGHAGGGEAARVAAAAAEQSLAASTGDEPDVRAAVAVANDAVGAVRDATGGQPGTTLTMAAVRGRRAVIGHAGDSRAYLVRSGVATALTTDHSWVGQQVRDGVLQPGAERHHPRRNIITLAVMGEALEPEIVSVDLAAGDVLVLCSDGFWEPLEDEVIAALLETPGPLTAVVERAAGAALDAGASDNVTVVAIRVNH